MNLRLIGITAALTSAAAWAVGAIILKKVGECLSASGMNLAKAALSLVLLASVILVTGFEPVESRTFLVLGISGLIGISLGDTFFFKSLQKISPLTLILLTMSGQVLTALFAVVFLGDLLTTKMWGGILLTIWGIFIALYCRISNSDKKNSMSGIFYGLLFVLCMSISTIIAKKGLADVSAFQATFIRMLWGAAGLLAWGSINGQLKEWLWPFKDIQLLKTMSLAVFVVTFGGFWLFHVALKYIDVSVANTLSASEPLFLIPLTAIFLKEKITLHEVMGTIISISGMTLLLTGQ